MKQYFIRIAKWYYGKNRLEEAAIEMVKVKIAHQLVEQNDLPAFWIYLQSEIQFLNENYKKATPLGVYKGEFNDKITIGRSGRSVIEELIIIEAVAVKGTFLTNPAPIISGIMQPINLFIGPAESGKTSMAHELYDGRKATWVCGRTSGIDRYPLSFALQNVTSETETIIIDDVPFHQLSDIVFLLYRDTLSIQRKGKPSVTITRPEIVITCETTADALPLGESFKRRVNVTVFPEKGAVDWLYRKFSIWADIFFAGRLNTFVPKPKAWESLRFGNNMENISAKQFHTLLLAWAKEKGYIINAETHSGRLIKNIGGQSTEGIFIESKKGGIEA